MNPSRKLVRAFLVTAAPALVAAMLSSCVPDPAPTEPPVRPSVATVSAGECAASLDATLDTSVSTAQIGESIDFSANLRNEPVGPCIGSGVGPSISGTIHLTAGTGGATVNDAAVFLTSGQTVLPRSSGLTSIGNGAPGICPGGPDGCTSAIQETVGNVDYPGGLKITAPESSPVDLSFRYYPALSADELASLGGVPLRLNVVLSTNAGYVVSQADISFGEAPPVENVTLRIQSDATDVVETAVGTIGPGEQIDLEGLAPYTTSDTDPSSVEFSAVASGQAAGQSVSATDSVTVQIAPDGTRKPQAPVNTDPDVVESGIATSVFVSVRTTDVADSAPLAVPTVDGVSGIPSALQDDGANGDLVADDLVYSGTLEVNAGDKLSINVTLTVGGIDLSGDKTLEVVPAGTPIAPTTLPVTDTISGPETGVDYIANRLIIRLDDEGTIADAKNAAALVGGSVVGRISADSWQILVSPAFVDYAAFEAAAATVSGGTHVIGVDLETIVNTTDVVPDDPELGLQWHHDTIKDNQAWIANRGQDKSVIVAVIDTGVDLKHPDLSSQLVAGRDFANGDYDPQPVGNATVGDDHGTHVAGIIGAAGNNGVGVAGVSWGASIMPVKVFADNKKGASDGNIAAGIRWAVARGAKVINLSLGSTSRSEDQVKALEEAWLSDVLVVASAGNDKVSTRNYPAAYERSESFSSWFGVNKRTYTTDVIAVGATDENDDRSVWSCKNPCGSNFGGWVDIAAPGTDIYSTVIGGYDYKSGTSMASPVVAGVASLVRSQQPKYTTELVRDLLTSTGADIGKQQIGRRVDAYEATINGSFESGPLYTWSHSGDARSVKSLGPIKPRKGKRMALIGTGPGGASTGASLTKSLKIDPAAVVGGKVTVSFKYNYVTEEYPEYVGSNFNDYFRATIVTSSGEVIPLAEEEVNTTAWTPISGIDFPGGDSTVGQSGWKTVSKEIPVSKLKAKGDLRLVIQDVGDDIYDSVALIDSITFR